MNNFKTFIKKTWIIGAAAALVAGSTTVMAYALNNSIPENANKALTSTVEAADIGSLSQVKQTDNAPVYTLVDRSKLAVNSDQLKHDISLKAGVTGEKADEIYKEVIANMIPGEKDMTAEQAAAYCADIIVKAYGVDLTGYTADTSFSRNPVPYYDNWGVIFHAPDETQNTIRYYASVNSVSGVMLDAGFYSLDYRETYDTDLSNPDWLIAAEKAISELMPANVTIAGSKVVSATEAGGVMVVCDLSDGSACGVRMTGENKDAVAYIFFPNGYDGSLDYKPVTEGGVG